MKGEKDRPGRGRTVPEEVNFHKKECLDLQGVSWLEVPLLL